MSVGPNTSAKLLCVILLYCCSLTTLRRGRERERGERISKERRGGEKKREWRRKERGRTKGGRRRDKIS